MDLTDITSALGAAAPYAGAIEALANLGIDITKLITPDLAQQYDDTYKSQLAQFAQIMAEPDGAARADQLASFVNGVCLRAGTPAIGVSGDLVLPVAVVVALVNDALLYARERAINDELILGTKQLGAAAPAAGAATGK